MQEHAFVLKLHSVAFEQHCASPVVPQVLQSGTLSAVPGGKQVGTLQAPLQQRTLPPLGWEPHIAPFVG
jgi:hypothetical protein